MPTDREDAGEPLGERDRGGIRLAVGPHRHHGGDAGGPGAIEHRVQIGEQLGEMQVRVGVEEPHQLRSGSASRIIAAAPRFLRV